MSGYTPVFDTVYDGTLCGRWPTLPVWLSILPMADKNGHIDLTCQAIAARTGWPLDLLKQGIAELMAPDPESRTPECDGRRLELLDDHRNWGWRVINHEQYRNKARKSAYDAERTASGADAARKAASRRVPTSPDVSRVVPPSDANTDSNSNARKETTAQTPNECGPEFLDFKIAYPNRAGDQGWRKAERCWNTKLKEGYSAAQMVNGAKLYAEYIRSTANEGTQYVKQACVFLGPELHFLGDWKAAPNKAEARLGTNISELNKFLAEGEVIT